MLVAYLILFGLWISLGIWSRLQLSSFLKHHPRIADEYSLKNFEKMVRQQMYAALLGFAILIHMLILSIFLCAKGLGTSLAVLILYSCLWLFIQSLRKLEIRVRSLECQTPELLDIYQKVCQAWIKDPLPNF